MQHQRGVELWDGESYEDKTFGASCSGGFSTFTLKSENFLPQVQVRLIAAKEAGREVNVDKKDETVRGSCDRRQIERHGENWYFLIVT